MTRYLFEHASAAKSPARMSRLLLHLLVRFSVPKQLFASSKTMADSPTDIDGVFAFKRQNVAKERFYSVVQFAAPTSAGLVYLSHTLMTSHAAMIVPSAPSAPTIMPSIN
jgi:hypothetical protein